MGFFAECGEYPAAGLYSYEHIILLLFCFFVLTIVIIKTRKKVNNPVKVIKVVSIVILVLEVIKVIWGSFVGRYNAWYEYLPLWFCSLFIPISIIAGFTKGKVQHTALTFMFYGGIVGGIVYLFCPTTSIGRYPLFHFITFHSMFYHVLMIYMGYFIIYQGLLKPNIKDLKWYFYITTFFCIISLIINKCLGTNYMFLSGYSNNPVLELIYNLTGVLYPLVIILGQNLGTFFISFGIYKLIEHFENKEFNNQFERNLRK